MLKRWQSFSEAIRQEDFGVFLKQIRRKFSIERAESLLCEFSYECDVVREDYNSDEEFASAVMGIDHQWLTENFS